MENAARSFNNLQCDTSCYMPPPAKESIHHEKDTLARKNSRSPMVSVLNIMPSNAINPSKDNKSHDKTGKHLEVILTITHAISARSYTHSQQLCNHKFMFHLSFNQKAVFLILYCVKIYMANSSIQIHTTNVAFKHIVLLIINGKH